MVRERHADADADASGPSQHWQAIPRVASTFRYLGWVADEEEDSGRASAPADDDEEEDDASKKRSSRTHGLGLLQAATWE